MLKMDECKDDRDKLIEVLLQGVVYGPFNYDLYTAPLLDLCESLYGLKPDSRWKDELLKSRRGKR